jgi:hypothetical protein
MASARPAHDSDHQPSFLMVLHEEEVKVDSTEGFLPKRVMRAVLPTTRLGSAAEEDSREKLFGAMVVDSARRGPKPVWRVQAKHQSDQGGRIRGPRCSVATAPPSGVPILPFLSY